MLKKIAIGFAVVVVAFLGFAATRPDTFRVQRSVMVKAPPEKIAPLFTDFHTWANWSPYEKLDPSMKRTYSGATQGKGAVYGWEGNDKSGSGRMEILDTDGSNRVTIQLDFMKPFEAHNTAEFTMEPQGDSTKVTWAMFGPQKYISKVMCLFFDMEALLGKDFESGLTNVKTLSEKT